MRHYFKRQIAITLLTLLQTTYLLRVKPISCVAIWLILSGFFGIGAWLSNKSPWILGGLFLCNMAFWVGTGFVANQWHEEKHSARVLAAFFAPFGTDERFSAWWLGAWILMFGLLFGTLLNGFSGSEFFYKQLFFIMILMMIWFAPSYFIFRHSHALAAIILSILSCLKNIVSWFILLLIFWFIFKLLFFINLNIWLRLPIWAAMQLLLGVCSYVHYCAAMQNRTGK